MTDPILTRRSWLRTVGVSAVAGVGLAGTAAAGRDKWNVELEAVEGVQGNPHGGGMFTREGNTMKFALDAKGLTSDVLAAHIHKDAPLGTIMITLYPKSTTDSSQHGSTFDAKGEFTGSELENTGTTGVDTLDDLVSVIDDGDAFVRAHTGQNPPGEVFGVIH